MRNYFLFISCVFLWGQLASQALIANPQDNNFEGGELQLLKSNASYNSWNIDNYAGRLRFFHGGSVFFDMHPSGFTEIPNALKVNGALRIASESGLSAEGSISEGNWGNYIVTNNTTTRTLRIGVSNDSYTRGEIEIENNNSPSSNIFFKTSNTSGGANVRMKIADDGKVGIGTTAPDEKLHVNGTTTITSNIGVPAEAHWKTGHHSFELQNSDAGEVVLSFHRAGYTNAAIKHTSLGGLLINGHGDPSLTHLFVKHSGDIGIGTTSPDAKLAVKGQIHSQEVKVDLNGAVAPDYVFDEDYHLKSLEEVQEYINQNGHLPNIPSAKEMQENGILLKEMNLKLLEKIEELTLYTIAQQKTIELLKKRLQKDEGLRDDVKALQRKLDSIEKHLKKTTDE